MSRVYTAPGQKAPAEKIKKGGSDKEPGMKGKSPKTPKMGG